MAEIRAGWVPLPKKQQRSFLDEIIDKVFPYRSPYSWENYDGGYTADDSPTFVETATDGERRLNKSIGNAFNNIMGLLAGTNYNKQGHLEKQIVDKFGDNPVTEIAGALPYSLPLVAPVATALEGEVPGALDLTGMSGAIPQAAATAGLVMLPRLMEAFQPDEQSASSQSSWETFGPDATPLEEYSPLYLEIENAR